MKNIKYIILCILVIFLLQGCKENVVQRPNIIYILADDLGYGELGCYGQQKIETPNIDKLAEKGVKFTNFYTGSPVCAPSRCILMTGQHSGHAYIRGNDEVKARGDVWNYRAMAHNSYLEGQFPLADSIVTIAEKLSDSGYATSLFGKWGLGYPGSESTPNKQGFDYFYGYNCQRQAHTLTPLHLWRNEEKVILRNDTISPKTKLDEGANPYSLDSYEKYKEPDYAPTVIFEDLLNYLDTKEDKPLAIFWETPIPHVPLQAPQKWIDHYVEKFGEEEPYLGDKGYFPTRYPNATYAAMISYLDENVGLLIEKLKEIGEYENTVIMFSSDNGPTYAGGVDPLYFESAHPFKPEYGWGKGFLREGGIRVPLIVSWPDKINASSTSNHISSSQDVYPTLCEIAGIAYVQNEIDGLSFLGSFIEGKAQPEHEYLYWEFPEYGGQQAVRKGNMKAYIDNMHNGNDTIQLYNLADDPLEQNDIANSNLSVVNEMRDILKKEHSTTVNPRWVIAQLEE